MLLAAAAADALHGLAALRHRPGGGDGRRGGRSRMTASRLCSGATAVVPSPCRWPHHGASVLKLAVTDAPVCAAGATVLVPRASVCRLGSVTGGVAARPRCDVSNEPGWAAVPPATLLRDTPHQYILPCSTVASARSSVVAYRPRVAPRQCAEVSGGCPRGLTDARPFVGDEVFVSLLLTTGSLSWCRVCVRVARPQGVHCKRQARLCTALTSSVCSC